MKMRSWLLFLSILCFASLSGCASRQLQSPPPFEKNIPFTLADDDTSPLQEEKPLEFEEDEEDFEDPFADVFEAEELEKAQESIPDPLEPMNRAFFHFNDKLYFWVLKPVARGYGAVLPEELRIGIRNIFSNLAFPVRFVNCLLQGQLGGATIEFSRFTMNTIFGIGGFFDVATKGLNLPKQDEDLGQTLGVWGFGNGFYLTLPFLGPSSFRDGLGRLGDAFLDPLSFISIGLPAAIGVKAGEQVNKTSLTLGEYEKLKEMALDPYVAFRSAYFQYRQNAIREQFSPYPEKTRDFSQIEVIEWE
jgi:phospholipid-binding lipoprotein MlaA